MYVCKQEKESRYVLVEARRRCSILWSHLTDITDITWLMCVIGTKS